MTNCLLSIKLQATARHHRLRGSAALL